MEACVERVFPALPSEAILHSQAMTVDAAIEEEEKQEADCLSDCQEESADMARENEMAAQDFRAEEFLELLHEKTAKTEIEKEAAKTETSKEETPKTEAAAEKNPWVGWAWLGICKNAAPKIPNIVHVDVDAFFASVEQVLNPALRGKPVLVWRGAVASASYEAKARGVKTAMSFREALRI